MAKLSKNDFLTSGKMKMPIFGLGTWQATPAEIDIALNAAIDAGYRHIDTAYSYGNEAAIGASLKKMFASGKITREELFIVTKLPLNGNRSGFVEIFLTHSLRNLQLDYVDLYLIHFPVGVEFLNMDNLLPLDRNKKLMIDNGTDILDLWRTMETQVVYGRTKSIGLSNFNQIQVDMILDSCLIRPANLQVELHVYLQQKGLVAFCKENDVAVVAYSPLGSPGFRPFGEKTDETRIVYPKNDPIIIEMAKKYKKQPSQIHVEWTAIRGWRKTFINPLEDPLIIEIAKKYNKQPSQILLRYLLEYGVAVIPKSTNPTRIKQNIDVFDFELSTEDFERISALDCGEEGRISGGRGSHSFYNTFERHPDYPFPK